MLKSISPGNWPLPAFLALPTEPGGFPDSLRRAVRLLYAGAAATVAWGLCIAIVTPDYAYTSQGKLIRLGGSQFATTIVVMIVFTAIFAAAWLKLAQLTQRGLGPSRIVCSVLFVLWTVLTYTYIPYFTGGPALIIEAVLTVVIWLIGLGTIVMLWRPESSAFFRR